MIKKCQHFKPKYIEFGKKLRELTDQLPGVVGIETYAVSCVPNKAICKEFKIGGYPSLKIFPANSVVGKELSQSNLHPTKILQTLGISTDQYSAEKQEEGQETGNLKQTNTAVDQKVAVQRKHFMARSKKETFDDAHLSLVFLLRHGIYTAPGQLPKEAHLALNRFVSVLSKATPLSSSLQPVIASLDKNSGLITTSEEALVKVLDELAPPPSPTWSPACLQHGTGYTCGLWTLFHIVTVGVVEWNLLSGDPDAYLAPLDVADTLRNFIEYFFQCDDCRAHFLSEYDSCGHDRCNRLSAEKATSTFKEWKELPLWLYETHNGVNTRLRQERLDNKEDEDTTSEWQVQWPPVYDCPNCWLSQGRWDEEQIYRLLRLQYWPEDYRTPEIQDRLSKKGGDGENLHPDVVSVMRKHKEVAEEPGIEAPQVPLSLMVAVLFSIVSGYVYNQKRKYDMKGYHKKRESDSNC